MAVVRVVGGKVVKTIALDAPKNQCFWALRTFSGCKHACVNKRITQPNQIFSMCLNAKN
jgi:hypothetical protein